jgi:ubiquinone/menaquinone biosynthesis C-methylase UbiE/uncharacterized protein YbaR (Trm112 family)
MGLSASLLGILECPRHHTALSESESGLQCQKGCEFPIVGGIPVILLPEKDQTIGIASASFEAACARQGAPLYLNTLGLSDRERDGIKLLWSDHTEGSVDPVISYLVGATSGYGYVDMIGDLTSYPIPRIPVQNGEGRTLIDIGCNWGRWSVSAARKGWSVIGIDPSLGALLAAKRAFENSDLDINFVCGDARFLPFKSRKIQAAFSYSVLQHFSEGDAKTALGEIGRVLQKDSIAKIQMAHSGGFRSTYVRTRADYIQQGVFKVRYWTVQKLKEVFENQIGHTTVKAEAFGGLGLLEEDFSHVNVKAKCLIAASFILKRLAPIFPPLTTVADSVYVTAISTGSATPSSCRLEEISRPKDG